MNPNQLLDNDTIWKFYESEHERHKYEKRIEGFLIPIIMQNRPKSILEIGAGNGYGTLFLQKLGYNAHAVDPFFRKDIEKQYPFLHKGSGLSLPFEDDAFDLSFSLEVIEHIGTDDGALKLSQNYWKQRQQFVLEMCRVTRNIAIIATPNKRFPFDEHGSKFLGGFRFHSPFEKETLSVCELVRLFSEGGFFLDEFLNPHGYYALERVERIFGKPFSSVINMIYHSSNNRILGRTPLNPHLFMSFRRR
jgi:SAM-dependent methyltransferase